MPRVVTHRPLVELGVAEHRVRMAATASSDLSRELGLAAVAHLSRYRGTSREHTESDRYQATDTILAFLDKL